MGRAGEKARAEGRVTMARSVLARAVRCAHLSRERDRHFQRRGLSEPADHPGRAVSARRQHNGHGPHCRRQALSRSWPADRGREQRRRRRHHRYPFRGKSRTRRLHHPAELHGTMAIAPAINANAGYDPRKDLTPIGMIGVCTECAGRASVATGALDCRADRLRQGSTGASAIWLARSWNGEPSGGRIPCERSRREDCSMCRIREMDRPWAISLAAIFR